MNSAQSPSLEASLNVPFDRRGVEDGAFHTDAPIVPSLCRLDARHAAEANADAACHWGFERNVAGRVPALGQLGQGMEHRLGSATDQLARRIVARKELRHQTVEACAA